MLCAYSVRVVAVVAVSLSFVVVRGGIRIKWVDEL